MRTTATTIKIDSQVLEPWRDIAGILGMTLSDFLAGYLSKLGDTLRDLGQIGEEISDWPYKTRERAQAVTDRFETFAIERKLSGDPDVGTVAAEAASVIDDWNGANDNDDGNGVERVSL